MKTYNLSFAAAIDHEPKHPERTAKRNAGLGMNFDQMFQVWPNRKSMARSIRMQESRESQSRDWKACVSLKDGEGY